MPRTLVTSQVFRPANILINGLFDHWQYSTSAGAGGTPAYNTTDRWMNELSGSGAISFDRSTVVPNNTMRYSMQLTKGTAASATRLNQRIEADNILPYIGKTVCFSFWIRLQSGTVSTSSMIVRTPLVRDTWSADNTTELVVFTDSTIGPQIAAAGVWKRIYTSFVVTPECVNGMSTQLQFNVGTDFVLQVAGCMLTEGSTPPEDTYRQANTVGEELILCQRYAYEPFYTATASDAYAGAGICFSATAARIYVSFPVIMRVPPTFQISAASHFSVRAANGALVTNTALVAENSGTAGLALNSTVASGLVAGNATLLHRNTTSGILRFDAEL